MTPKERLKEIIFSGLLTKEERLEQILEILPELVEVDALDWIEKSHHHDGCSWSRALPMYTKCSCGKLEILNKRRKN